MWVTAAVLDKDDEKLAVDWDIRFHALEVLSSVDKSNHLRNNSKRSSMS